MSPTAPNSCGSTGTFHGGGADQQWLFSVTPDGSGSAIMKKNGDGDKTSSFARNNGDKVKGYRKQDNFGATKFIKP